MSEAFQQVGADPIPEADEDLAIRPEEMGVQPESAPEENDEPVQMEAPAESEEPAEAGSNGAGEPEPAPEEKEEEEPPAETEPEPVAGEPESEPQPDPEPVTVPKARLDKALRDKRALEQQLQQLQTQQQQPAPAPQQSELEQTPVQTSLPSSKEIAEALLDGDLEKYAELMELRDNARDQQLMQQVQQTVPLQVSQQQQKAQFDQVKTDLETRYSFLDNNAEDFDAELTETVVDMATAYARRGYTHAEALQVAADKVLRYEKPELFVQAAPAPVDNPKVAKVKEQRMNIDQKLAAAAAQPPRTTSIEVQNPDTVPDFSTMSDEEFDKYTPQQIEEMMAKMREDRMG